MIVGETADDFYLPDDQVSLPSERDGVPRGAERDARMLAAELIQEAGILLSFPQAVVATGQVLMHRFFCRRSVRDYSVQKAAAACLWLAAKLEEVPDVSRHPALLAHKVMLVFDRCCARRERSVAAAGEEEEEQEGRKRRGEAAGAGAGAGADEAAAANAAAATAAPAQPPPPPVLERHSREYLALKDSLVRYEREVLRACGYVCAVEHPHKLALGLLQAARLDRARGGALAARAWACASDSLRTTLCVRVRPVGVACGAIFVAARQLGVAMPGEEQAEEAEEERRGEEAGEQAGGGCGDGGKGEGTAGGGALPGRLLTTPPTPPWYEVFGATAEEVVTVARELHALYSHPRVVEAVKARARASSVGGDGGGGGGAAQEEDEEEALEGSERLGKRPALSGGRSGGGGGGNEAS